MHFAFADLSGREKYKLLTSAVTPRPIAWVVSQDSEGRLNAAPFSFFNAFNGDPPVVGIAIGSRESGQPKDSRLNIRATGEFVVNLVSEQTVAAMNVTSIDFPSGIDELQQAGLSTAPSCLVKPPRIAESPVAIECRFKQEVELGGGYALVLGTILAIAIRDDAVRDPAKLEIDVPKLGLVGRMHGAGWYARQPDLFQVPRITREEWELAQADT
jgi:flavin reductase (DIM6/NTAB) family NADH-FMN oxidoreductase RutF